MNYTETKYLTNNIKWGIMEVIRLSTITQTPRRLKAQVLSQIWNPVGNQVSGQARAARLTHLMVESPEAIMNWSDNELE